MSVPIDHAVTLTQEHKTFFFNIQEHKTRKKKYIERERERERERTAQYILLYCKTLPVAGSGDFDGGRSERELRRWLS